MCRILVGVCIMWMDFMKTEENHILRRFRWWCHFLIAHNYLTGNQVQFDLASGRKIRYFVRTDGETWTRRSWSQWQVAVLWNIAKYFGTHFISQHRVVGKFIRSPDYGKGTIDYVCSVSENFFDSLLLSLQTAYILHIWTFYHSRCLCVYLRNNYLARRNII